MIGRFKAFRPDMRIQLEDYCRGHPFWGSLDDEKGDYKVFENRAKALHLHWVDLVWLFNELSDYRSKYILFAFLNNWYYYDMNSLGYAREQLFHPYFDMDIIKCGNDEVFADIGASDGINVLKYMSSYDKYKKIYCYEPSPEKFAALNENLKKYKNIETKQADFVALDNGIKEPVTFIKIYSRGYEQKALLGCARHIRDDKPKLAVSVYENYENIWKIPRMLTKICPGYKYYLRYHGKSFFPTDLVFLAVYE
jgi:hypothetical protein